MMGDFHFLRPSCLIALIPLAFLIYFLLKRPSSVQVWEAVCDKHLLAQLLSNRGQSRRKLAVTFLAASAFFMVFGLAGPVWEHLPVPTYKPIQPRIIILDMSESMLTDDLPPDRLSRAKFKLHDLFTQTHTGQYGLIAYSGEPFVISPLTEDSQTIDALLSSLTPDVMPVAGDKLDLALEEAGKLFTQAGFHHGEILVLTASAPSEEAISAAATLAQSGFKTSVLPVMDKSPAMQFQELADAGKGALLTFSTESTDIEQWLNTPFTEEYSPNLQDQVPVWRDEGRWFLIPALLLLLPVFRRGWLEKVQQ